MATKISALPPGGAVARANLLAMVQSGVTVRITAEQFYDWVNANFAFLTDFQNTDGTYVTADAGVTNNLSGIQLAFDTVIADGRILIAPAGDYGYDGVLTLDTSGSGEGIRLIGTPEMTVFRQMDANLPCLVRTGRNQVLDGILWRHDTMPTTGDTRGCGWEISGFVSQCNDGWNKFYKVYAGIQPAAAGTNAMFASHIAHLICHQYAHTSFDFRATVGGQTPVFIASIYTSNMADDGATELTCDSSCFIISAGQGPIIGHLHIENVTNNTAVFVGSDVDGAKIGMLHIENFIADASGMLVDVAGNGVTGRYPGLVIDDFQVTGSTFLFANTGNQLYSLFRVGTKGQIVCHRFSERANTIDLTNFRVVRANTGDNAVDIDSAVWVNSGNVITTAAGTYTTVILTADTSQDSNGGLLSLLRRWLGSDYFRVNDLGAAKSYEWWTAGAVAPTAGTWVLGSIVWSNVPVIGGVGNFWRCTTAGTPGTWVLERSGGSFQLAAAAGNVVADVRVAATSRIFIMPTNAAAATLMGGATSLYVSAKTAGASFTLTTANGAAAAGTETFDYMILN